ncbi:MULTISPECIES: cytochrome bd oxidase small subunit CydS [Paenibacillus]
MTVFLIFFLPLIIVVLSIVAVFTWGAMASTKEDA